MEFRFRANGSTKHISWSFTTVQPQVRHQQLFSHRQLDIDIFGGCHGRGLVVQPAHLVFGRLLLVNYIAGAVVPLAPGRLRPLPRLSRTRRRRAPFALALAHSESLAKHWLCFLDPFSLKLGDASLPRIVEIASRKSNNLGKKGSIFGMSQNLVPPSATCLTFGPLRCVEKNHPSGIIPDFGQNGSKKHTQCFTTGEPRSRGDLLLAAEFG